MKASIVATLAMASLGSAVASAATITVASLADSGSGSLRAAVATAAAGDTIQITATGTITLTSGEIAIARSLNITGPGSSNLSISGNGSSRIFSIIGSSAAEDLPVTISGVTLTRGSATGACPSPTGGSGGAIIASESLLLADVVFTGNAAARNGGGLAWAMRRSGQALKLANTTFSGNTAGCTAATAQALGGGLYVGYENTVASGAAAVVTISSSAFIGNTATRSGGGIAISSPATATIATSRVVGNTASNAYGGGIYVATPAKSGLTTASVVIQSSEIAENTAALAGGAINHFNVGASTQTQASEAALALVNSTVSGNVVSGGSGNAAAIAIAGNAALSLDNSTVAYNRLSAAASGAAITRSACTVDGGSAVTREPLQSIDSSIVAMTNGGSTGFVELGDAGASFANAWAVGTSLIQRSDAALSGAGNVTATNPQLLTLAFNGGSTRTHGLAPTSPAIDSGSNSLALIGDQRGAGVARSYGSTVDMGAFEYNPLVVTVAEYYVSALDSYFISGRPSEQYLLDTVGGFRRTGSTFQARSATATDLTANEDAVCRYYLSLSSPYSSTHFYGFKATDCASIASVNPAGFSNEGYDFAINKSISYSSCPAAAPYPVYRSFRAAANGKTPNHRYSTSTATRDEMTTSGWANEGVAFCATAAATVQ